MNTIQTVCNHSIITSIIDDIIIKIETDRNLIKNIQRLPSDIIRHIYDEYIDAQLMYEKFVSALDDPISQMLNQSMIRHMVPLILAKPRYIEVCCKIPEFNIVYKEHKIRKQKCFRLMNNGDSFATSILFYKYH